MEIGKGRHEGRPPREGSELLDTVFTAPLAQRDGSRDEAGWLVAARAGEPWALERFFHAYQTDVYRLCHRLLGRAEDAQDATQTTFVRAFRDLHRFRGDSSVKTWVYRIAVNESVSQIRRRRESPSLDEQTPADGDSARSVVERLAVEAALRKVSHTHRDILVLRFWEGLTYEELAQVLRISLPAVKMRLHRARDDFRRHYENG